MIQKLKIILITCLLNLSWSQNCCDEADVATDNCEGLGCYIPQCTEDCIWNPVQCWSSTGYCWCVDEDGSEIEGTSIPSWQGFPVCEQDIDECFDFTEIDFGECDMYLGIGLLNNQCNYISGCDWVINGIDYSDLFFNNMNNCQENCNSNQCGIGFVEINNLCFYEQDINVLQMMIDISYESDIDLDCYDGDNYCGSPNPFMDSADNWGWISFDGISYEMPGDSDGIVEPLELGLQEWENGRLTSFMCGAYIYCQLSGPIPQEINNLTELRTFRVEGNYFNGFIPESICDLDIDYSNSLNFDVSYNQLCPPYPECIYTGGFWGQHDVECSEIGDINYDSVINILDVISLVSIILDNNSVDYQTLIISDINLDSVLDVLDVILMVDMILN